MQPIRKLWRQTPPAIFPPIMGLFGLGLAWRRGEAELGLPAVLSELILGAASLLFLFALIAWLAKPFRRPSVVVEELRVLPGRAGLAAMTLSLMLFAAALVPHAPRLASLVLLAGVVAHTLLALLMVRVLFVGRDEARTVTPVWHLSFVGFIIAPLAGIPLGYVVPSQIILYATVPLAALIWAASLWQMISGAPPAPLRPLLAIHLAPACLFASVAAMLGMGLLALAFALFAAAIALALLVAGRWIAAAGFSPLWGAFTFPLAALASALFAVAGGASALQLAAGLVMVVATLAIPPITYKVLQAWARGGLAARTNAARV
jgi:tellurite resistance protein